MKRWRLVAKHKWVTGASIWESCPVGDSAEPVRSFTATVRGFRNWKIYRGKVTPAMLAYVIERVTDIRERIDGDEDSVWSEPNEYAEEATL